jgi:primosomal protein N' (replication factor Y)
MSKNTFVDLILPVPIRQLFTYSVPEALVNDCQTGKRAVVQFGKKKIYSAIIKKVHQNKPSEHATKNILNIIDERPIISETQFKFWDWMADYYMCSLGDVYKAALPAGLRLESNTNISYNEDFFENEADFDHLHFSERETLVLDSLKSSKTLSLNEINEILSLKNSLPHIKSLYEKGAIKIQEKLEKGFQAKTEKYIGLNPEIADDENLNEVLDKLKRAPKQFETLNYFLELSNYGFTEEPKKISQSEFQKESGCSVSIIKELIKKDILLVHLKDVSRLEFSSNQKQNLHPLSKNQLVALKKIEDCFADKDTVLLHGVTSSGKTEIYIHLIDKYLKEGKQVLYLLPEIALTSQIVERLKRVFGNKVGVYHSKYNDAERVETWQNIQGSDKLDSSKQYQIILGVRSSVFLPFKNLGLVIVDEEHENTFKQFNPAPRYQARDAAILLANLHGAKTLLGSATPSVESYFNAKSGKFGLVTLDKRHLDMDMPEIIVSNIKEARRKKQMKSHFSPLLLENIKTALEQNEQIILFQNRRGFAPYIECHSCGWIPKCEHCDVSLTYHRHTNQLVCHYCGFSYTNLNSCPECKETDIRTRGFGTEKVEEDLKLMFPEAEIKRLDLDTSRGKKAHSKLIADFEKPHY